jgi:hypothetical protein
MAWKKQTQVFQTAGEPPRRGNTMRDTIGCTANSKNAEAKSVTVNTQSRTAAMGGGAASSSRGVTSGIRDPLPARQDGRVTAQGEDPVRFFMSHSLTRAKAAERDQPLDITFEPSSLGALAA